MDGSECYQGGRIQDLVFIWIQIMREKKGVLDDAAPKSLQSCPTLCNLIDSSPPGSPVPRILQARTLDWVAISFSNAGKWKVKVKSLSRVQLLGTPWTAAYQAPPSMGFSRQEDWSGLPLPSLNTALDCCYYTSVAPNLDQLSIQPRNLATSLLSFLSQSSQL